VSGSFGALGPRLLGRGGAGSRGSGAHRALRSHGVLTALGQRPWALRSSRVEVRAWCGCGSTSRIWEGWKSSCRLALSETRGLDSGSPTRWRRGVHVRDSDLAVQGAYGERHERSCLGNQARWSGKHLEEQQTRRGERSRVRSNRRARDSRLCMDEGLEVEVSGPWQPIRR
jgi:hypothetical protein